jgi:NADH-quinone oxidoreductase subunit C
MQRIAPAADPVATLQVRLPDVAIDTREFRGELTVIVEPAHVLTVAQMLRDTEGLIYNYLSDISAVDYYPEATRPGRFGVSYHLYSMLYNRRIRIKTYVQEDEPIVPSVTLVYPAANWLEREIYDMMGIVFEGHPDLRRVLLPDDWNGHPHRRDYPLGYETIMFSFNADEVSKHKPYAKD